MNKPTHEAQTSALEFERQTPDAMRARAESLCDAMRRRRSVRHFSSEPVPDEVLERCVELAAQAPSGANKQPWTFVIVTDPEIKRQVREAAEAQEREFYGGRAPQRWLDDLAHLGTDSNKPFLEDAPALIVVFAQSSGADGDQHYYVKESVGLATGMLIMALHLCGLATLTHTPSPMRFLGNVLGRPSSERAFLLLPVGYPTTDCRVPDIQRKPLAETLARVDHADRSGSTEE